MSNPASQWCTIESDPGVFTSLIESFGVKNAELAELWSLDDDSLRTLVEGCGKVHGLIFLFKWQASLQVEEEEKKRIPLTGENVPEGLFFAKQVTTNACATQAILSVLLNSSELSSTTTDDEDDDGDAKMKDSSAEEEEKSSSSSSTPDNKNKNNKRLVLGPTLSSLRSFTQTFPPDLRGEAIGASEEIRTAHNSFARNDSFLTEEKKARMATDEDDVFHFVAYVPHVLDGNVYELDGLQSGPIRIGPYEGKKKEDDDIAWLKVARTAIQGRIERYATSEIKFNLMAVVRDRRIDLNDKIHSLLTSSSGVTEENESILTLRAELASEEEKRKSWEIENERRRHNYLPFCVELIRVLGESGTLVELTEKANERMVEVRKKAMEAKRAAKQQQQAEGEAKA